MSLKLTEQDSGKILHILVSGRLRHEGCFDQAAIKEARQWVEEA